MLKPKQLLPDIQVPLLEGTTWNLYRQRPKQFTLIVFYRGHHCPTCRYYLHSISSLLTEFNERGIEVIAISANTREKATQSQNEWYTGTLPIGYGFPIQEARQLGLYISNGIKPHEPDLFFEPAIFIVRPDNTLYSLIVQSMPFARPYAKDLLQTFDMIISEKYPPGGDA